MLEISIMAWYSKIIGLEPTYSIFLFSNQLTTSIDWPYYRTAHDNVVIHFCDSVFLEWKRISADIVIVSL